MKLASIEQIKEVNPHPNADRLDLVSILGYQLVCEKGLHNAGDVVVYIQPDTVLPEEEWAETYRKYSPKRVKAVKLRGEWSEGIVVRQDQLSFGIGGIEVGTEVSDLLHVTKYEPPLPQDLSAKGLLPLGIPVTDQERWENLDKEIPYGESCDVTVKIDGQSCSFYYDIDTKEFGILGRRLELKGECANNYTDHLRRYPNLKQNLIRFCEDQKLSLCIRGESYGPGIQTMAKNPYSKGEKGWAMFSVWNIKERKYESYGSLLYFENVATALEVPHVPIIERDVEITPELIKKYSIDMKKLPNGNTFEGVVLNHKEGTFKVINKHYDSDK